MKNDIISYIKKYKIPALLILIISITVLYAMALNSAESKPYIYACIGDQTGAKDYEITPLQAEEIIKRLMGIKRIISITRKDDISDEPECYSFEGRCSSGEFCAMITKSDGKIRYFNINTKNTENTIPEYVRYSELEEHAKNFLCENFGRQFSAVGAQFYGGRAIIDLVPKQADILLYTDMIKVWVDIKANEIAGTDSYNFLLNNKNRYIPAPKITQETAREKLSERFEADCCSPALISTEAGEVLCYEFSGNIANSHFLVYINAATGEEEKILNLDLTDDGIRIFNTPF